MKKKSSPQTSEKGQTPSRKVVFAGRHLDFCQAAGRGWEFVSRKRGHGVVGVVAIDSERQILLVEQWRAPVGANVLELPAGLAGDEREGEESLLLAAQRELLEETGYEAGQWRNLGSGCSSAGLTDEQVTLFLATDLRLVHERQVYGVGHEQIQVHRVALSRLRGFLKKKAAGGCLIDFKIHAGAYLAERRAG